MMMMMMMMMISKGASTAARCVTVSQGSRARVTQAEELAREHPCQLVDASSICKAPPSPALPTVRYRGLCLPSEPRARAFGFARCCLGALPAPLPFLGASKREVRCSAFAGATTKRTVRETSGGQEHCPQAQQQRQRVHRAAISPLSQSTQKLLSCEGSLGPMSIKFMNSS